jgi:hypothetical protein
MAKTDNTKFGFKLLMALVEPAGPQLLQGPVWEINI